MGEVPSKLLQDALKLSAEAAKGSFVLVPGGVLHDFENRVSARAGVLNLSIPGPFEPHMPGIVQWFTENPPKNAGT